MTPSSSGSPVSWTQKFRVELILFSGALFILASFSSFRFLRQSEAPHFVYQAKAWLEGRLDIDPRVVPNLEDWACVRTVDGQKVRCDGNILANDRWYVSFPFFPAVLMLPFVAVNGYQFNDTSFGVVLGALALALFYSLLRHLSSVERLERRWTDDVLLTLTLGFGTVFFYCAIRGEVWFLAEVLGVALTCLYVRFALRAQHPVLAGLFFSMAVLTRTPLLFTGVFFLAEVLVPGPDRKAQLASLGKNWAQHWKPLLKFGVAAAPLGVLAAAYNSYRFGKPAEFGHSFLYNNRVNADIDRFGLFSMEYLPRNLRAAFTLLPQVQWDPFRLDYDPHGLSLLLTLPLLLFVLWPRQSARLQLPLWLAVAVCALPGLLYQNTGYMQFGFRFSLDYTPYLLLLFAVSGWSWKRFPVPLALALGFVVNFWGAVAFKGYTEWVRGW